MSTTITDLQAQIEQVKDISPYHQRITIGPFDRGYGYTVGNALRRVLLSSMPGFAPTMVKIEGCEHQYSTLPGVTEDVIEILLNLKRVAFRVEGGDKVVAEVDKEGPGAVTAGDIKMPGQASVINKDHHIATLAAGSRLAMSVTVEGGRGYVPAPDESGKEFGTIMLDASFSPVRNVAVEVESARVDSRTDLDRIIIDLKTNGVHNPEEMIRYAASILVRQLELFAKLDVSASGIQDIGRKVQVDADERFYQTLESLESLNIRIINNLKQENVHYIGDLVCKTEAELLKTPRLGRKSVDEIKLALAEANLALDMDIGRFEPDRTAGY